MGHGDVLPADAAGVAAVPSRGTRGQLDRCDDAAHVASYLETLAGGPPSKSDVGGPMPFPTHSAPNPTAMSVGVDAVPNVRRTSRVCGSILETVLSSASMTQTEPSPRATFDGVVPSGTRTVTPSGLGVKHHDLCAVGRVASRCRPCDEGPCDQRGEHECTHDDGHRPSATGVHGPDRYDRWWHCLNRRVELVILFQDLALQLLQWPTRLDSELLRQETAAQLVHLKGLGLAPRAVQGEHALRAQALPQRVLLDEPLQLHHERPVLSARQVGLDPFLQRRKPELLEAADLRLGERLIGEVGQCRTTPHVQRCAKRRRGARRITRRELRSPVLDERLDRAELSSPGRTAIE